jgi:hypothetical protein
VEQELELTIRKKVKLLYMPWRHIEGMEVYLHSFLTLALDGGERWISCLSPFIRLGKSHQYHLRSSRMGRCSWSGLFGSKITVLLLAGIWTPDHPAHRLVTDSLAPYWSHGGLIKEIVLYKEFLHELIGDWITEGKDVAYYSDDTSAWVPSQKRPMWRQTAADTLGRLRKF